MDSTLNLNPSSAPTARKRTPKKISIDAPAADCRPRISRTPAVKSEPGVIAQIVAARRNPLALATGFILGAFPPIATFATAHLDDTISAYFKWLLVLGGLVYSALSVYGWFRTFNSTPKALGYVVLLEGAMCVSGLPWVSYAALALLVGINAVAQGANLSLKGTR